MPTSHGERKTIAVVKFRRPSAEDWCLRLRPRLPQRARTVRVHRPCRAHSLRRASLLVAQASREVSNSWSASARVMISGGARAIQSGSARTIKPLLQGAPAHPLAKAQLRREGNAVRAALARQAHADQQALAAHVGNHVQRRQFRDALPADSRPWPGRWRRGRGR